MSRSNPNENASPNPAVRWFEWNGETGTVRYYDKDAKKNVEVGSDFTFLLLDELGSVRGWHDPSESGIYSNEVKDTRQDALIVKSFKGGTLAEGIYRDIKDRVGAVGGQFVANCYIAFKLDGALALGSMRFKGSSLGAWMEFRKAHRADIFSMAIRVHGFTEGKKGRIVFRVPVLETAKISEATNAAALALDKELQTFLAGYFKRTKREQVENPPENPPENATAYDSLGESEVPPYNDEPVTELTDDDIPF